MLGSGRPWRCHEVTVIYTWFMGYLWAVVRQTWGWTYQQQGHKVYALKSLMLSQHIWGEGGYWAEEDCHMPMYRISAGEKKSQLYVIKLIKGRWWIVSNWNNPYAVVTESDRVIKGLFSLQLLLLRGILLSKFIADFIFLCGWKPHVEMQSTLHKTTQI